MPAPDQITVPVVATTRETIEAVPYLGPLPVPSRAWLRPLQATLVLSAGAGVLRASAAWLLGARVVLLLSLAFAVLTVGFVILDVVWRRHRRPRTIVAHHGEAYVEAALNAVAPTGLRVATYALWPLSGMLLLGVFAGPSPAGLANAGSRLEFAAGNLAWAAACLLYLWWTQRSAAAIDRRLSWSGPYRDGWYPMPFFTPLSEQAAHNVGEPSGIGWILRTGALVFLAIVATLILIGSVSMGVVGIPWFVGSASVLGLIGYAFWRRAR